MDYGTTHSEPHPRPCSTVFKGSLQKTYFVIQPACQFLPEGKKEEFMSIVSRDTPNDKLTGLIEAAPEMFDIMDHLCSLSNHAFGISPKLLDTFRLISLGLSFFINLLLFVQSLFGFKLNLVFVQFEKTVKGNSSFTDPSFNEDNQYLDLVGYCHVLCGAIQIVLWLMIEGPITIMNGFRLQFREYSKVLHDMGDEGFDERQREIRSLMNKNMRDLSISQRITIIEYFNQAGERSRISATIEYIGRSIILVLRSGIFQYLLFYLTSSVFSLAYNLMLLYAIHLLAVINRFQTLQNVIKAITYNSTQLILTGMLALLVIYIYALFAYYFVNDTFFMVTVGDAGENVCTTVIQCYLTLINWVVVLFILGTEVSRIYCYQDENKTRYYIRWWYDFTSFAIVNIIFLNIIFGIIIDTFAELRDQNNTKENDMKNVCFICSFDRHNFENKGDGFEHHIEVDHNVWNYIYFLYGIKRKDPTEYNGVEGFVSDKMEYQDVTWIPVLRALVIPDQEDSSGNLDQQLESLVGRVKGIHEKIKLPN